MTTPLAHPTYYLGLSFSLYARFISRARIRIIVDLIQERTACPGTLDHALLTSPPFSSPMGKR